MKDASRLETHHYSKETQSACGGSELPDAFDLCNAVVGDSGQCRDHLWNKKRFGLTKEISLNTNYNKIMTRF